MNVVFVFCPQVFAEVAVTTRHSMLEQRPDTESEVAETTVVKDTGDAVIVPAVQGVQVGDENHVGSGGRA